MMRGSTSTRRALLASVVLVIGTLGTLGAVDAPAGATDPGPQVTLPGWDLPGQPTAHLTAVSCGAPKDCIAVGSVSDATGAAQPFASHRLGSTWTPQPVDVSFGHQALTLSSVSCPSVDWCAAVGAAIDNASISRAVAATWSGAGWDVQAVIGYTGLSQASALAGVSCPSPTFCTAVGWSRDGFGVDQAMVYRFDGSGWGQVETTGPPLAHLSSVACASDVACTAVGVQGVLPSVQQPVVATLQTGTWDIRTLALGGSTTAGGLLGVSCPTEEDCTAVGFSVRKGVTRPLVATRAAASWTMASLPVNLHAQWASEWPSLSSVSCTSVGSCAAVGSSGGLPSASVEVLRRGSWRSPNLDDRTHSSTQSLLGVSCVVTTKDCTAVGSTGDTQKVAVASPHGGEWRMRTASNPDGPIETTLSDVSCASPTSCVAVARSTNILGTNSAALDIYDGSSWTPTPLPKINGIPGMFTLSHVSCPSPTWCAATATAFLSQGAGASSGYIPTTGPVPARGVTRSYLLIDAGGTWSARAIPRSREWAGNGTSSPLIACPEVDQCTVVSAVGNWTGSPTEVATVRFDGSGFGTTTFPLPQGTRQLSLFDSPESLSCPTVTWCAVVGGTSGHPWAAIGDGSSWALDVLSQPVGIGSAGLTLVSCWAPGACKAIGQEDGGFILGQQRSFTAYLDGGRWTTHNDIGGPSTGSFVQFTGLSCAGAQSCVVVGSDISIVSGQLVTGALLGSDAYRNLTPTPEISVPSPMVGATFSGVSCAGSAPRTCVAVGGAGTSVFGTGAVPIVAVGTFGPG